MYLFAWRASRSTSLGTSAKPSSACKWDGCWLCSGCCPRLTRELSVTVSAQLLPCLVPKSHLARETWALWWHPFPCSEFGSWGVLQVWPEWEAGRWEMAETPQLMCWDPHGVPIPLGCAEIALGEGSAELGAGQPPNAAQIPPEPPRSLHIWP